MSQGLSFAKLGILIAFSGLLGVVLILNQFGPLLQHWVPPSLRLQKLDFLWEPDLLAATEVGYTGFLLILAALVFSTWLSAPSKSGCKSSFLQGLALGFLAVPATAVAGALGWLALRILLFLFVVLGVILVPVVWILEHIVGPVLQWLATPLIWLWENGLRDVVIWLLTPVRWLVETILAPISKFLAKYVFIPLGKFALRVSVALLLLLPVCLPGTALISSFRTALRDPFDSVGLFSHGVGVGFALFDCVLLSVLAEAGVLTSTPPLSLTLLVGLALVGMARLLILRLSGLEGGEDPPLKVKIFLYLRRSWIEAVLNGVLGPTVMILRIVALDSDSSD
ncbi:MAG: hypothetical protein SX243_02435 [Acidobacteriota bacterium]|nr:hypothetical protein [Acidobacteriota bacterium]